MPTFIKSSFSFLPLISLSWWKSSVLHSSPPIVCSGFSSRRERNVWDQLLLLISYCFISFEVITKVRKQQKPNVSAYLRRLIFNHLDLTPNLAVWPADPPLFICTPNRLFEYIYICQMHVSNMYLGTFISSLLSISTVNPPKRAGIRIWGLERCQEISDIWGSCGFPGTWS